MRVHCYFLIAKANRKMGKKPEALKNYKKAWN
jgi:hypothetical protein